MCMASPIIIQLDAHAHHESMQVVGREFKRSCDIDQDAKGVKVPQKCT